MAPPNRKRTATPESPPNCKRTAAPESPGGAADSPLPAKKQKHFNASLFLDSNEWPLLNRLWDVVGNRVSETYLKSQGSVEEYTLAARVFFGRLCLVVCDLHLDQLIVIFHATVPMWYGTAARIEKSTMIETFEEVQAWMEQKLVSKMKVFSQMWYQNPARSTYHKAWHYAK